MSSARVENAIPVLGVADLFKSHAFYTQVLSFTEDWGFEPGAKVGSVGRDGSSIMLSEFETPGMTVWVGVEDIVPFYKLVMYAECEIVQHPTNQPWAFEFRSQDPDGNTLWFGSGPIEGVEFGAEVKIEA
jgi:catechol 2,3-dioxygenase-like lactoylglutathione lyase family enzyme